MTQWRILFGCCCLSVASYFGYLGYLETRVNTPFDDHKITLNSGLNDPEKYWGSYRPGQYFGLKTRDPHSLLMGLMWFSPMRIQPGGEGIRHWCENGDELDQYGWTHHDGKSFGRQTIEDFPFTLETSFVKFNSQSKYGGDWTARISVRNNHERTKEIISLIWYTALDDKSGGLISTTTATKDSLFTGVRGETPGLGEFSLSLHESNGTILHRSYVSTIAPTNVPDFRQAIIANLRLVLDKATGIRLIALNGEQLQSNAGELNQPNFIANMITGIPPFSIDIAYKSTNGISLAELKLAPHPPIKHEYTTALNEKLTEFSRTFDEKYRLREKGYNENDINFAQAAISNMIGGIGYFYGASRVQSSYTKDPVPYWKAPLYTGVPSRSFFPRGFLWDEGFHGLLISSWDVGIELDIISHWFDLMNVEGWIPREQILGSEALAKVPEEFVTQHNTNANPPTFFLSLKAIIGKHSQSLMGQGRLALLERLYPRLQAWFTWYNFTQKGEVLGSYRWRGRDGKTNLELNPKTLTSGLDDYPRASHPNDHERHVDLRCWIAFAAGVMADLAHLLGRDDSKYLETHYFLSDNYLLNELHLSPYTETYADWGLHTDSVILKWPPIQPNQMNRSPQQSHEQREKIRYTLKDPEPRFVDTAYGYVSLFPFLLEILTPDSPYLGKILEDIRDPKKLWTDYGIRSLSKTSPIYMKHNTHNDPPYWRGQIWINMNYLTLKALHHYASQPGQYSEEAKRIYVELRHNIVNNIIQNYKRTGYIWEQYNDETGHGSGCKPFTGWSALVVLIMAEQY